MLVIDIRENNEEDGKIHHKTSDLNRYLITYFLIKISYFVYFYIVDNADKTSWLLVICYYISLGFLFYSLYLFMNGNRLIVYNVHWKMNLFATELMSYFCILLNYYILNRGYVAQDKNPYFVVAMVEIISVLLINGFTICHALYTIIAKKGRSYFYIVIFSVFIILSLVTHLHVVKTAYQFGIKLMNNKTII